MTELIDAVKARFDQEGVGDLADWVYELVIDTVEPIIRADALSRFSITEFPNGKIQTLIADGTHWVTVSTANSMVDRARADEQEEADHRLRMRVHEINDQVKSAVAAEIGITLADLRAKVMDLRKAKVAGVLYAQDDVVSRSDVLALLEEKP